MFKELEQINIRPEPFQYYSADELWTDEYTSGKMLEYHLNEAVDLSSRNREFIERSTDWITSRFNVSQDTCIGDFGCGPGLYSSRLALKGADVVGIDFSSSSIQFAREAATNKGLKIDYIECNYLEFETEKQFDLIIMIMCDFCALSPDQRKKMLKKFNRLLKPGGFVLLDAYSLNSFYKREETAFYELNQLDGFWSAEKYYGFLNTYKYENEKVILDKYTIIEESRTRTIYNWLQYFSMESIRTEFEENGFEIAEYYSDVAGRDYDEQSDEIAVVAKKI